KVYENQWLTSPEFIIGTLIFVTGLIINWRSDALLIGLRKQDETGYKIPYGGLFKYVSCPNLLGETIEWGGFAILTWSLPGLAFFVWTFANLIPRAIAHHRWYKQHFSDYPEGRKAVIPFLW
ncbi:MAG TPA: 3-oxo-5-alpha-steroid 4-dehydrogenase, partial [Saprospiraceae bacterium]|nr:3-oxo-5-alpha-steroid 4-dehydrogenase [Saprospiraceae bacterium]